MSATSSASKSAFDRVFEIAKHLAKEKASISYIERDMKEGEEKEQKRKQASDKRSSRG